MLLGRTQSKSQSVPPVNTAPSNVVTPSGVTTPHSPGFLEENHLEQGIKKTVIPSADTSFAQFKKQALENAERVRHCIIHIYIACNILTLISYKDEYGHRE